MTSWKVDNLVYLGGLCWNQIWQFFKKLGSWHFWWTLSSCVSSLTNGVTTSVVGHGKVSLFTDTCITKCLCVCIKDMWQLLNLKFSVNRSQKRRKKMLTDHHPHPQVKIQGRRGGCYLLQRERQCDCLHQRVVPPPPPSANRSGKGD